ncbi:hypothetical protein SGLAM104S_10513 [Streptomyces glaucescens]
MVDEWRMDRIGSALRGENPAVLRRLNAGFAAIGDVQFLPGCSVLLVDDPNVERLSDLPRDKRLAFLSDMDQLGEAVERVSRRMDAAFRRVNLEILGNTDGFLHAHVWPRFEWEPTDLVRMPVWLIPATGGPTGNTHSVRSTTRCVRRSGTSWTVCARRTDSRKSMKRLS